MSGCRRYTNLTGLVNERSEGEPFDVEDRLQQIRRKLLVAVDSALEPIDAVVTATQRLRDLWVGEGEWACPPHRHDAVILTAEHVQAYAEEAERVTRGLLYLFEGGVHENTFKHYGVCAVRAAIADLEGQAAGLKRAAAIRNDSHSRSWVAEILDTAIGELSRACLFIEGTRSALRAVVAHEWSGDDGGSEERREAYRRLCDTVHGAMSSMVLKQLVLPCLPFMELVKTRRVSISWLKRDRVEDWESRLRHSRSSPWEVDGLGVPVRQLRAVTDFMTELKNDSELADLVPPTKLPYLPRYVIKFNEVCQEFPVNLTGHACWIFPHILAKTSPRLEIPLRSEWSIRDVFRARFTGPEVPAELVEEGKRRGCSEEETKELLQELAVVVGETLQEAYDRSEYKPKPEDGVITIDFAIWFV
jgi:hypothetical protein